MKPNACVKSLNSNTRCRFPFSTLQPLSFRNSSAICCSESFVAAMKSLPCRPRVIRRALFPAPLSAASAVRASGCGVETLQEPVNGMVRRRSLEVVECGGKEASHELHVLGIDLAKTVFHLVGLDSTGR